MNLALAEQKIATGTPVVSRLEVGQLFRRGAADAGACAYLVVDSLPAADALSPRILACDWAFDEIETVGLDAVILAAESAVGTPVGTTPRTWHPSALAAMLDCPPIGLLATFGHEEICVLRFGTAGRRCFAIISGARTGGLDDGALIRLQMRACHALSCLDSRAAAPEDPLSERERECLFWVAEGKTTDEAALILEVSANTINSYVAHAIHKLGATNRAMAVATAIRRGIV